MRHNCPLRLCHHQQINLRCHIPDSIHPVQAGALVFAIFGEIKLVIGAL